MRSRGYPGDAFVRCRNYAPSVERWYDESIEAAQKLQRRGGMYMLVDWLLCVVEAVPMLRYHEPVTASAKPVVTFSQFPAPAEVRELFALEEIDL